MMKKTIVLNGENFTLIESDLHKPLSKNYDSLFGAYGKPSSKKVGIYNSWKKWLYELKENDDKISRVEMWVFSRNPNIFTLAGVIEYIDGKTYGFYITKTRQEIWECD